MRSDEEMKEIVKRHPFAGLIDKTNAGIPSDVLGGHGVLREARELSDSLKAIRKQAAKMDATSYDKMTPAEQKAVTLLQEADSDGDFAQIIEVLGYTDKEPEANATDAIEHLIRLDPDELRNFLVRSYVSDFGEKAAREALTEIASVDGVSEVDLSGAGQ